MRSATENLPEPPEIMESVRTGHPATELIAASADADLLVVGSHGHWPTSCSAAWPPSASATATARSSSPRSPWRPPADAHQP
ncbi:universal stress protein [Labedaea rhizosphaerae]|uniref:universal stress protein n=1 Tax=Labedaea rhizosphaerae TaxID=598644 RepID=UPI001FB7CC3C|nr:universal stress protein [Labedaea rhizosphaerae]